MREILGIRAAGVLLHPTCLPSPHGVGDFGPGARAYLSWLARAGVQWWQVLPLNPTGPGNSPYSAISTFAGDPLLISPEDLAEEGLIPVELIEAVPDLNDHAVDFGPAASWKLRLLRAAWEAFSSRPPAGMADDFELFSRRHGEWLNDFCLFTTIRRAFSGAAWFEWPEGLARRQVEDLERVRSEHADELGFTAFCQYLFFRQWAALRDRAAELGVSILGDVPIFVAHDSAEVWSAPENFLLHRSGRPKVVAGVPPDYFSDTGQLWGNPLYDWQHMADNGYRWWIRRLRHTLEMMDAVRLDHFRGFAAYWEVPAEAEVATHGRWVAGPGLAFFDTVREALGGLPFLAEDLGEITPDVVELRRELGLPGMAILHFGFDPEPRSTFIPYSHQRDQVVYTGTHDNNTSVGWFLEDASDGQRDLVKAYAGTDGSEVHWDLIRMAMASVADLAVVPHQDLAGVGADCRMNTPAVALGNWRFRITDWMLKAEIQQRLAETIRVFGRAPDQNQRADREGEGRPERSQSR